METLSLYIHWPFCVSKCPYCDFNSHVRSAIQEDVWKEALLQDLKSVAEQTRGRSLKTIFFGGGTPSLMNPRTVDSLIEAALQQWQGATDIEITLEANPNSVEVQNFRDFKRAGINRVSLGVQALRDPDLKMLGRLHGAEEALKAIRLASEIFDRFSFDLIYARHQQTLRAWRDELKEALSLCRGHLSLYQLTIEHGTAYETLHKRGALLIPDEELAADFYEVTQEIMEGAAMPAYEISNHATPGQESRHNLTYWRGGDYVGIGPGAHGRLTLDDGRYAIKAYRVPERWLEQVKCTGSGVEEKIVLEASEILKEKLMMGLRLREGIPLSLEYSLEEGILTSLIEEGLLIYQEEILRTTTKGRLCLNSLLSYVFSKIK